jgi:glycosidase
MQKTVVVMAVTASLVGAALLAACSPQSEEQSRERMSNSDAAQMSFYGTLEPFASEAVYFVVTDRFVNGDPSNDQREQGGSSRTFDRPVPGAPTGDSDNIGYLGGDFKGVLDQADYIRNLGFSGYHGYWGVNFYQVDEHLPSVGLDFAGFTSAMHAKQLKVVLDIVGNHGAPAYTMPVAQAEFGKVYGREGNLLADHQNLAPEQLDPDNNPLHRFFNKQRGIAELSDFNENNPAVLDYLVGAYEQWAAQGADAFRIDTIGWMPHSFWKKFADRIRTKKPGMFMFGEDFRWNPEDIAPHTRPENGGISVLDFPLKAGLAKVFENGNGDYSELEAALHLEDGPYHNPYELMTFYDNHDMARMNASDEGFIDAHNWLFTARGIPVIYYGSETGFMRGRAEHAGNRNFFGIERVQAAVTHPIYQNLQRIAKVRTHTPALQRGLQLNLELNGDKAAFYRVLQHDGQNQLALVLLNKGDSAADFTVSDYLEPGQWRSALSDDVVTVAAGGQLHATVAAHGVQVFLLDAPVTRADLKARLQALMVH